MISIERRREIKTKHKIKKRNLARDYILVKKQSGCLLCPENHPRALDFHHRPNTVKKNCVSKLVAEGYTITAIQHEIDKCDLLCSNCHRKSHYKGNVWHTKKAQLVFSSKSTCFICGESNPGCLDLHHIDPQTKELNLGAMTRRKEYTLADVKLEIAKCCCLCSNCHRKLHSNI